MRSSILLAAVAGVVALATLAYAESTANTQQKPHSYVPIGTSSDSTTRGAAATWAWFIDTSRNRVVYCAAANFQAPPQCFDGPIP